jgi:hypothetical protein
LISVRFTPLSSRDDRDRENFRTRGVRAGALERTLLIAFVVGSWLNLFNHGDALLRGAFTAALAIKLALNDLTPFIVSNFGLLAHQRH